MIRMDQEICIFNNTIMVMLVGSHGHPAVIVRRAGRHWGDSEGLEIPLLPRMELADLGRWWFSLEVSLLALWIS